MSRELGTIEKEFLSELDKLEEGLLNMPRMFGINRQSFSSNFDYGKGKLRFDSWLKRWINFIDKYLQDSEKEISKLKNRYDDSNCRPFGSGYGSKSNMVNTVFVKPFIERIDLIRDEIDDGFFNLPEISPINNSKSPKLLVDLLLIASTETENRHAIFLEKEDYTNDRFRNALVYKGYNAADQSRGGESRSGKSPGERDIVIRNSNGEIESIIEAFILTNCDSDEISFHYRKLTERYDTAGNQTNFVLIYSKAKEFENLWIKYREFFKNSFSGFIDESEKESKKSNIKVGVTKINDRMCFHIFINFFSDQTSLKKT